MVQKAGRQDVVPYIIHFPRKESMSLTQQRTLNPKVYSDPKGRTDGILTCLTAAFDDRRYTGASADHHQYLVASESSTGIAQVRSLRVWNNALALAARLDFSADSG
jgi:hypothetical protein